MIILLVILILLILLCAVRISNNQDLIVANCKDENDLANINNAKKVFRKTKIYNYLLIFTYILIIVLIVCAFTDIDFKVIDYFSTELIYAKDITFNYNYFFAPFYILVIREIFIQVKIGEFLLKYFKVDEPVLEENPLKNLLYKKTASVNKETELNKPITSQNENTNKE